MPYLTEVIDGGTGILRIGRGVVTGQEIIGSALDMSAGADPKRITHAIVDFTEVTSFDVTAMDVRDIAEINTKKARATGIVYIAIVAPNDIAFGMSRMYGSTLNALNWIVHTFRAMEDAEAWLNAQIGELV